MADQQIELPNGDRLLFPTDMPDADIQTAIEKEYPQFTASARSTLPTYDKPADAGIQETPQGFSTPVSRAQDILVNRAYAAAQQPTPVTPPLPAPGIERAREEQRRNEALRQSQAAADFTKQQELGQRLESNPAQPPEVPIANAMEAVSRVPHAQGVSVTGPERYARDFAQGELSSTGSFFDYLGAKTGLAPLSAIGKSMSDYSGSIAPKEQKFADHLASGLGSFASFYIPGLGVQKGVQLLSAVPRLAQFGGATAMAGLESAMEAGSVYDTLIQQGKTHQQALAAADKDFMLNAPVILVTDKLAFFNNFVGPLKAGLVAAGTNAAQEAYQQGVSNTLTDRPLTEGMGESAVLGGIIGGGAGALQGALATPPAEPPAPANEVPPQPKSSLRDELSAVLKGQPVPMDALAEAYGTTVDQTGKSGREAADVLDKLNNPQGHLNDLIPGSTTRPVKVTTPEDLTLAAQNVDTQPTEAQKDAGNYAKGHIIWQGLPISIENPAGSVRSGKNDDGTQWDVTMPADYGYIKRTEGADGDQVDVYLGPNPASQTVFIVDQIDPATGKFDEHKNMLGFDSAPEAIDTYQGGFSDGSGVNRMGAITQVSLEDFKAWLKDGKTDQAVTYVRKARSKNGERTQAAPTEVSQASPIQQPIIPERGNVPVIPAPNAARVGAIPTPSPSPEAVGAPVAGSEVARPSNAPVERRHAALAPAEEHRHAERRTHPVERKKVADMTHEELRYALLTDHLTDTNNRRAYEEAAKLPIQASVDVDSLKWVNDNMGHAAGDRLLKTVATALKAQTGETYHISGDEFVVQGRTVRAVNVALKAAQDALRGAVLDATDQAGTKTSLKGVGFSYGLGKTLAQAEEGLHSAKADREKSGLRAARGEVPPGVTTIPKEIQNAQAVRSNERQIRARSAQRQPSVQRSPEQGGGNIQQPASRPPVEQQAREVQKAQPAPALQSVVVTPPVKPATGLASLHAPLEVLVKRVTPARSTLGRKIDLRPAITRTRDLMNGTRMPSAADVSWLNRHAKQFEQFEPQAAQALREISATIKPLIAVQPKPAYTEREQAPISEQVVKRPEATYQSESNKPFTLKQVSPEQALQTKTPLELPTDPEFAEAVRNTPGAEITKDGLLLELVRYQKQDQEGAQALRTGVFYLPIGATQARYYRSRGTVATGNPYGGSQEFKGQTLIRKPLFVKGATGGKMPEAAYDTLKGKGAYVAMSQDVNRVVIGWGQKFDQKVEDVREMLKRYGGTPSMAGQIVNNSREGNQLPYAVKEHIVAHAIREAGYDVAIGYSKKKVGLAISEVFDVREQTYPSEWMESEVHQNYLNQSETAYGKTPIFYSQLANQIEATPDRIFQTGRQMAAWLDSNSAKLGIKKAEIEATGITDWLKLQGKVTKADVQDFIKQGGVQVQDVMLGNDLGNARQKARDDYRIAKQRGASEEELAPLREARDAAEEAYTAIQGDEGNAKFASYQLPGGENYRELLLMLPSDTGDAQMRRMELAGIDRNRPLTPAEQAEYDKLNSDKELSRKNFKSQHFDQLNILAHIRFNERTDAEGRRVLFLEEIQSDWGQKGKKGGFKTVDDTSKWRVERTTGKNAYSGKEFERQIVRDQDGIIRLDDAAPGLTDAQLIAKAASGKFGKGGLPSAPFVTDTKSWTALALKRMIRYAADNSFDKIAWTTGEQQAARYDLSKQIEKIDYVQYKKENGYAEDGYHLIVTDKNGDRVAMPKRIIPANELENLVGKEVANKIIAGEGHQGGDDAQSKVLSGLDLKVGGEGMKGYYDQIVPQVANEVLKKIGGGKVEDVNLSGDTINKKAALKNYKTLSRQVASVLGKTYSENAIADMTEPEMISAVRQLGIEHQDLADNFEIAYRTFDQVQEEGAKHQQGFAITSAMQNEVTSKGLPLFQPGAIYDVALPAAESGEQNVLAVQQDPESSDIYHVTAELTTVGKRKLPARINTVEDAARAFSYLPQYAVEHYDAIITNAAGKPLAIIGSFKGAIAQASVFPSTVLQELALIPDAKVMWASHNHPSGKADLSSADKTLSNAFSDYLRNSGIDYQGLFATTKQDGLVHYSLVDSFGRTQLEQVIGIASESPSATVNIQERMVAGEPYGFEITSPQEALREIPQISREKAGVVLLSQQQVPVAFVALRPDETYPLREDGKFMKLVKKVAKTNAGAAFIVNPNETLSEREAKNLAAALAVLDVRVLDALNYTYDKDGGVRDAKSAHETGGFIVPPVFFSKADQTRLDEAGFASQRLHQTTPYEALVALDKEHPTWTKAIRQLTTWGDQGKRGGLILNSQIANIQRAAELIAAKRGVEVEKVLPEVSKQLGVSLSQSGKLVNVITIKDTQEALDFASEHGGRLSQNSDGSWTVTYVGEKGKEVPLDSKLESLAFSGPQEISNGFYSPELGMSFINTDHLSTHEVAGVVLHEILHQTTTDKETLALGDEVLKRIGVSAKPQAAPSIISQSQVIRAADGTKFIANPTREQAVNLAKQAKYGEIRTLRDPDSGALYAWDASTTPHADAAKLLGIDYAKAASTDHRPGYKQHIFTPEGADNFPQNYFSGDGALGEQFDFNRPSFLSSVGGKSSGDIYARVRDRMERAGVAGNASEAANYLVEEAMNMGSQAGHSHLDHGFWAWAQKYLPRTTLLTLKRWTAALRAALYKHGIIIKESDLKIDDIAAIAVGNMSELAAGKRQAAGQEQPQFQQSLKTLADDTKAALETKAFEYVDEFGPLQKWQKTLGKVPASQDASMAQQRYSGIVAARVEDFHDDMVNPLLEAIHASGIPYQEVEQYLYAKHAPSRNAEMERINPGQTNLSGMTNTEAAAIIRQAEQNGSKPALEEIAKQVYAITAKTRENLVAGGLMTPEERLAWEAKYKNYVPLHRDEVRSSQPPLGKGFSIKGPESKRALGSEQEATNILAHTLAQHEASIVRVEKNKVSRAMFNLLSVHPDPAVGEVDSPDIKKVLDKSTGTVAFRVDPFYKNQPHVLALKIDGVEHTVSFNMKNVDAQRMAYAFKNLGGKELGEVTLLVGKFTRFLATMSTSANPVFLARNFLRDLQTAAVNLNDTPIKNKAKVFANVPAAMRGFYAMSKDNLKSPWAKYAREFRDAGGQVGWLQQYKDIEDRAQHYKDLVTGMRPGVLAASERTMKLWWSLVEDANAAVENAVRLSSYVTARQEGLSEAEAAMIAKNLTVNFNIRGAKSVELNMWYMFAKASINGTARMFRAAKNPKVRKIMGGMVVVGFLLDALARGLAGDDDEDGENDYDQLAEYTKANNWVFWVADRPVTVPQSYGLNFFPNIGRKVSQLIFQKNYHAPTAAQEILQIALNAYSPIGAGGSLLQTAAPTIADPFIQLAENKNFAGQPIYKSQTGFGPAKPEYQMGFKSSSIMSKAITEWLNENSGGNAERPGMINMNPSVLDFAVASIFGGAGKTYSQAISYPMKLVSDKEIEAREIPFVNIFLSAKPQQQAQRKYYDALKQVQTVAAEAKDPKVLSEEWKKEHAAELALVGYAKRTQARLEKINGWEKDLQKAPDQPAVIEKLEAQIRSKFPDYVADLDKGIAAGNKADTVIKIEGKILEAEKLKWMQNFNRQFYTTVVH